MKISFCTTAMNRLHHIRDAFYGSLLGLMDQNVEFVLLDYNSTDGLQEWIFETLKSEIESGVLRYYRTDTPKFFHRSHSRNACFRLSTGTIVCNLDADNYVSKEFYNCLVDQFDRERGVLMRCKSHSDSLGRISFERAKFDEVRGFDESMSTYGFEELDFVNRLLRSGLQEVEVPECMCSTFIRHDDDSRIVNEYLRNRILSIFVRGINEFSTEILLLYNDSSFRKFTLLDVWNKPMSMSFDGHEFRHGYQFYIQNGTHYSGSFEISNTQLILQYNFRYETFERVKNDIKSAGNKYYLVSRFTTITEIIKLYSEILNRERMLVNLSGNHLVNENGYGQGKFRVGFTDQYLELI